MSTRYALDLALEPPFTAKAYQTRQIVCGQYASWAAEMQMLRLPLTPYFPCPEERLPLLSEQVAEIAQEARKQEPCTLRHTGIAADPASNGVIIQFDAPPPLLELQSKARTAAQSHSVGLYPSEPFRPSIALLEYGAFPPSLLPDATEFAAGVATSLSLPPTARPWRLLLTRYHSAAAADDWSNGRWAADLSWQLLSGYRLCD